MYVTYALWPLEPVKKVERNFEIATGTLCLRVSSDLF